MGFDWDEELRKIKERKLQEITSKKEDEKELSTEKEITVTDGNFESIITNANSLVVIDFWATWCGPCMYMVPIFEKLARKYAGKAVFGRMNVDENPIVPGRLGIYGIPTFVFFKNGKEIHRMVGATSEANLEEMIKKYL
ncbi:MAG: thioredoxin [Candidatus Methanosuratincola sp.]|jgi:thioredoxin 1|uniref:Thioredoxin n=1 Tax=Candidatus Methanosuratincola petrocarbonis (ex Vanwonterghem et al. 2016) TaxID=1867261 RepID=A0A7J3UYY3_9CREN|nr:thioredoxin [Candidatus Methanosuratincola sp.]